MSRNITLYVAALALLIDASPAVAQQTAAEGAQAPATVIEEIIVTAQKREQNLQDVPAAINAYDDTRIRETGIQRIEELANITPSITFGKGISFAKASLNVRGVGTKVFGTGVEPTVATVVDGIVLARGGAGLDDIPDIDRIEVLRGPQSTLYGKNASAGLIHIITKNPNFDEYEGTFDLIGTSDQETKTSGSVSGPIGENAAFRLSGYRRFWDGNVYNEYNGDTLNGFDTYGLRGKLEFRPAAGTSVLFSTDFSSQVADGGVRVLRVDSDSVFTDPAAIGITDETAPLFGLRDSSPATAGQLTGITGSPENNRVNLDINPTIEAENYGASLTVNTGFGEFDFISITGYRGWTQNNYRDNDQTQLPFALVQKEIRDASSFSQEFRLASPVTDRYDYILGLYYFKANVDDNSGDFRTFSNNVFAIDFNDADNRVENENAAVFGHLNYHPSDRLTLIGGFRFLRDSISATLTKTAYSRNNPFLSDGLITSVRDAGPISNSGDETKFVGKVGAQFDLNDDTMLYAFATTGYKGQAFNTDFKFNPDSFLNVEPVRSEKSTAIEGGFRSTLLEGKLQLNVTAFRTDFEDIQQTIRNLAINRNTVGNVPEVRSQGLEIDAVIAPSPDLVVRTAATFLDANYVSFANTPNRVDLSGRELPNAPELSFVADVRKEFSPTGGLDAFVQASLRYQSDVNFETLLNPEGVQDSYSIMNVSAGVASTSGNWEAVLYVNNVLDQRYIGSTTINGGAGGDLVLQVLPRDFERFVGLRVSLNY